jgi:lipopolysaccharide transport system permease protein
MMISDTLRRDVPLVRALVKREILSRYRGSFFGLIWSFITPLVMLALYTFVFGVVFKARWSSGAGSKAEFAMILFAGLIVFNMFAECIGRAPSIILSNVNYVKKVVFPLEVLPVVVVGASLFHASVSLVVWLLAYIVLFGFVHPTVLLAPVIIAPFLLFVLGLCWFLASLGVYVRDMTQFVSILTTMFMFTAPIVFPTAMIPEQFRFLVMLNPLTPVVEQLRSVLYFGELPDWRLFASSVLTGVVITALGYFWFQKTRKGFADVL